MVANRGATQRLTTREIFQGRVRHIREQKTCKNDFENGRTNARTSSAGLTHISK